MKQLLILLLVFSAIQTNAQWYTRQFGVTDITMLTKEQLNIGLAKAESSIKTGKVLTIVGITMTIGGCVLMVDALYKMYGHPETAAYEGPIGGILLWGGFTSTAVGIPLWAVGGSRKRVVTVQLAKFNDTSYIPSIGIKITF